MFLEQCRRHSNIAKRGLKLANARDDIVQVRVAHRLGSDLLVLDSLQHIRREIIVCIVKVEIVVFCQDAAYIVLASTGQAEENDQHWFYPIAIGEEHIEWKSSRYGI